MPRNHPKKSAHVQKWNNGKTFIKTKMHANASINQGGNAFAINASDIGVVRIRPQ